MRQTHYIVGSGSHGCLYDNGPRAHKTLDAAIEDLAETFELGRGRRAKLVRDFYLKLNTRPLELNPYTDGAEYCEITTCDCATPWQHNEDDSPESWTEKEE